MNEKTIQFTRLDLSNSGQVWIPCEYTSAPRIGVRIISLGDVENSVKPQAPYIKRTLRDAALDFLKQLPANRKIVILAPQDGRPQDQWPFKQVLKKDIDDQLNQRPCTQ